MSILMVVNKYQDQLLQLPNVTGIGIGERAGEEVIKVFVTHKVPESQLKPQEVVPRMLEDYTIDVEVIGNVCVLSTE